MNDGAMALMALLFVFGSITAFFSIFLLLIWTYHKRKMEEIKAKRSDLTSEQIKAEFAAVRAEIQSLRDTALQYDLSFDTALQQMERRVHAVERRTLAGAPTEETVQSLYTGNR